MELDELNQCRLEADGLQTGLRPSEGHRALWTVPAFGGRKATWNNQTIRSYINDHRFLRVLPGHREEGGF